MVVVQTDVLSVTILVGTAGVVGATGNTGGTLVIGTVVSPATFVVDFARCCAIDNADVVGADIAGGTVAVNGTSKCLSTTGVVDTRVASRTFSIMIARVRLLTDRILRVTNESSTAVRIH